MKSKKTKTLSAVTAAVLALGACAADEVPLSSMSCTELAIEIGKATQTRDDAAVDSVGGVVDMLVADSKEDEITGGVDALIGDVTGTVAQGRMDELESAFVQKGCR